MADQVTPTTGIPSGPLPSGNQQNFGKLVFDQDLSEVHLLLDFISGRPDKHLADLDGKIEDPGSSPSQKMTATEVIRYVAKLQYPPPNVTQLMAEQAANLLLIKDCLNSIAYPARGMTIAYTTMFTETTIDTNRTQLAHKAYPSLAKSAISFRRLKNILICVAVIITVLSAILLWQVSYGAQLAARFDKAKASDTASATKLYDALDRSRAKEISIRADATNSSVSSDNSPESAVDTRDINVICRVPPFKDSKYDNRDSNIRQLCDNYAYNHAQLCVSVSDVGSYSEFWLFKMITKILPMHSVEAAIDCINGNPSSSGLKGRQEDAQSVAAVLATMSNYALPVLFGLVGTLAAFVRSVQDKVTESILSPRDQALSMIRLPLGIMAGICVGLFLSPANISTQVGGGFTITASGVAFLAGYGAEAFFRALDALLTKVFK